MTKIIALLVCFFCTSIHNGLLSQTTVDTIHAPVICFTGNKIITRISTTIENSTSLPKHFHFPAMPQTRQQIITWVMSWVTNPLDRELSRLQIVQACGYYLKNSYGLHKNGQPYFAGGEVDSLLFQKQCDLIGSGNTFDSQLCGQSSLQLAQMCMWTGYFTPDDFNQCSSGVHAWVEVRLWGYFTHVDADVFSIGFMYRNPNSPNGWASSNDLYNDTLLINQKYLRDGRDINPNMSLSYYRTVICTGPLAIGNVANLHILSYPNQSTGLNGEFILPGSSSNMTTHINGPIFLVDTSLITRDSLETVFSQMGNMIQGINNGCLPCGDTLTTIVRSMWPEVTDSLLFGTGGFFDKAPAILYGSSYDQGKKIGDLFITPYEHRWTDNPVFNVTINSQDTVFINTDIKAPMLVVSADNSAHVGDTTFSNGFEVPIYSGGGSELPVTLDHTAVNYLDTVDGHSGWITSHHIQLAANANGDWFSLCKDWVIAHDDGLVFHQELQFAEPLGPLPVTLTNFKVQSIENKFIRLNWTTETELDNDKFIVMRSTDGHVFEPIGEVAGKGSTTITQRYQFDDAKVVQGEYYYQLQQVDYDGHSTLSNVASAKIEGEEAKKSFVDLLGQEISKPTIPGFYVEKCGISYRFVIR